MAIDFNADQNRMGLALLAAAGPSARPMSFGQRMFMGMGQHDQYLREKEAQEMLRKRQATQELLIAAQMQEMQAQAEQRRAQTAALERERALQEQFRSRIPSPLEQANQQAYAASGAPLGTVKAAAHQPQVDPNEQLMFEAMRLGQMTPLQYMASRQKDETPMVLGEGGRLVTRGGRVLAENPKAPKEDSEAAFLALVYGKDTPEYFAAMKDLAKKKTTHAPAATAISYGSPVPVQLSGGGVGYAQPGNRPGAAPQMMVGPDNKPLQKPPEPPKAMPEAATKQITGARNLRDAIANYKQQLQTFSMVDMLNPNERARMGNAYNNMMLQAKEAYNLGVLNGPDYTILQSVVQDPTNMRSAIVSNKALASQATELSRIASGIEKRALEAHGKTYKPGEDDNDPLGLRGGR